MRHIPLKQMLLLCCFLSLLFSCVKDVDFDQADDITLQPDVDVDLVFFTLETSNFQGSDPSQSITVVRDTTRLDFLDDNFVQDNLKRIDFQFQYDNTFSQGFFHRALFLNEENETQYVIEFDVAPSMDGGNERTSFEQTVEDPDLDAIRASIKLVLEITVDIDGNPIEGTLSHQSKALYALEF